MVVHALVKLGFDVVPVDVGWHLRSVGDKVMAEVQHHLLHSLGVYILNTRTLAQVCSVHDVINAPFAHAQGLIGLQC